MAAPFSIAGPSLAHRGFANWATQAVVCAIGFAAAALAVGCGTPGAPMPPSLKLPDLVTNLSAVRTGNQVALTWKMPRKNTDKLLLKGNIPARVCRKLENAVCEPVPGNLSFQPGVDATFTETLLPALASGQPRALTYFVELLSPKGRSAGLSNPARVVAGVAPSPVAGLKAHLRKQGAVLEWAADSANEPHTVIRLHRTLLTPPVAAAKPAAKDGLLAVPKEPVEMSLLADEPASGHVLDKTIHFGQTYEYRAQRVAMLEVEGEKVELAGPLSAPVKVEAIDTFPPAVPAGLAAVATAPDSSSPGSPTGPSIDLSWLPVPDADLAGYLVYRREGDGEWQRISPAQPVVGPAFHDADVKPGHSYRYAVTAIDQGGHESARSTEAAETVPNN